MFLWERSEMDGKIVELCDALLDCLWQECQVDNGDIHNMGMSCYEEACCLLADYGYLEEDGRCRYKITAKGKALGYSNPEPAS